MVWHGERTGTVINRIQLRRGFQIGSLSLYLYVNILFCLLCAGMERKIFLIGRKLLLI